MSDDILQAIAASMVTRNLNCTAIIDKAQRLEYCKRNILLAKLAFWDKVYTDIIDVLIRQDYPSKREWNANAECLKYIKNNELSNPFFAEFFFNFHEPLTLAFLRRLKKQLSNGMPLEKKFQFVASEITELLNIAYIELQGMDISCESFGGDPICPRYLACGKKDCDNPSNVFFVMMNEEYKMELGLFENILAVAMRYLANTKEKVIMIIDYKNMIQTDYVFGPKARARYDYCLNVVEAIYFYNWKGGLTFGKEFKGLEPYLIPGKKGLNKVLKSWREGKELVTFA